MRAEAIRTRLPVLMILTTLATSAGLLARGATSLFAGAILPLGASAATTTPLPGGDRPGATPPDPKAILARNAFDPTTGPLWPPRPDAPAADAAESSAEVVEELPPGQMPPACGSPLRLIASVHSESAPEWSFASIAGASGPPLLYRIGGLVQEKTVSDIYPSAVFLRDGSGRMCSLTLFVPPEQAGAAAGGASVPATTTATALATPPLPPGSTEGGIPPEELTKGIQQQSETKFSVQRSLVDKVLANQAEIMRSARIVPHEQNGQVLGVKLYGIRRNSLLGMLGLQNGDLLRTINGYDMASPDSALEAYSRLRSASQLTLSVTRRGQAMSVEYQIQ